LLRFDAELPEISQGVERAAALGQNDKVAVDFDQNLTVTAFWLTDLGLYSGKHGDRLTRTAECPANGKVKRAALGAVPGGLNGRRIRDTGKDSVAQPTVQPGLENVATVSDAAAGRIVTAVGENKRPCL